MKDLFHTVRSILIILSLSLLVHSTLWPAPMLRIPEDVLASAAAVTYQTVTSFSSKVNSQ